VDVKGCSQNFTLNCEVQVNLSHPPRFCSHNLVEMKKVFTLFGLMALFFGNQLVAQDNPCGVEGIVVEASNFQYAPAALEIEAGQTVVWVNVGGTHDVNGLASTLNEDWNNPETFYIGTATGNMDGVCLGSHTFTVEGTYNYDCSIGSHAANGMVATITVNPAQMSNSVVDIIVNSDDHTLLEAAVGAAGLVDALSGEGPFTVFAPTDDAIVALTEALEITAEDLLALPNLGDILQYHVVGASAYAADLSDGQMIETLLGEDVTVSITADGVFINNAQVTVADVAADNGVVHVIDAVLLPPAPPTTTVVDIIVNSEDHTLLEAAVGAAGLVDALSGEGPFTVFAPTDAAVVALTEALEITAEDLLALPNLGDILQYHVVGAEAYAADLTDGQMIETLIGEDVTVSITADGVFINNAQVVVADLAADNGVVHVIDAVLLPPTPETTTVVDIIVGSEDHTVLEAAVGAAGLVDALSGEGPFTVFAPTDAAFDALLEALEVTAEELLAYPGLADVLQYHVVGAEAYAADLSDGQMIETLLGEDVTVSITADGVFINNAQVIVADLAADNGVVHVIDAVLVPPTPETTTVVDIIVNSEDHTLLEAAVVAAGLVDALSGEGPFTVFAPTDAAVVALTEALEITAEELLALPNLGDILQYHVVGAEAYAADLSDGQMIETLQGGNVTVSITAEGVFINQAQVIVADLAADNGVVHVIDAVLLPPTSNVAELASFELNVFPNPVAGGVFNMTGNWEAGASIEIFELTGRKVFETTTTQNTVTVSTEGWAAGTYAVRVADGISTATKMFLVD
jgi:uncharacterized surface protein with fasciclin (FAS1) repeats